MPQWRRTLYTLWVTQFISVAGFSFVTPFLPYYIQELGVRDVREVGVWAGLVTSAQAVSMAIMAPVWGALADRYGRKLMVLRATLTGALLLALMGFAANVQQLLVLRFVQGAFTGVIAATSTLVASTVPKERAGMALGSLQTAVFLGVSFGPVLGGLAGDAFGYRPSFWITGGLLLAAGLLVIFFVHEDFHPVADAQTQRPGYRQALLLLAGSSALLAVLVARMFLRIGTRALDPVLPLFVQSLLPVGASAGATTGLIAGVAAFGSAIGAPLAGNWGDRWGHRRILIIFSLAAAACFAPQALVNDPRLLMGWQFLGGMAAGGALAALTALLAQLSATGHEGVMFGLDASAMSVSNAVGPLLGAAVLASLGLRWPFVLAALIFGLGALTVGASVAPKGLKDL